MTIEANQLSRPDFTLTAPLLDQLRSIVHGRTRDAIVAPPQTDFGATLPAAETYETRPHSTKPESERLLVGQFSMRLDSKSRLSIPPDFRDPLHEYGGVMVHSPDGCLWVFGAREYKRIFSELQAAIALSCSALILKEYFTNHSYQVLLDATGRITVPFELRKRFFKSSEIASRDVVLQGSGNLFEIWFEAEWGNYLRVLGGSSK